MHTPKYGRRALVVVSAAAFAAAAGLIAVPVAADDADESSGAGSSAGSAEDCVVDEILVNSCRPWLGARAMEYPQADSGFAAQHEHHEERIGRQIDIPHAFAWPGRLPLADSDEVALAERDDTYLFQNWKPAEEWADAGGDDADVNAHIDAAADNVLDVADHQIFLTIHHEPENDVTSHGSCATKPDAVGGTVEEYVQMWHNVQDRFEAKGVDNVVWVMDYMNYSRWDCLVPELYPGDDHVDWIMFNAYGNGDLDDYAANVDRFYTLLTELSDDERDLTSKPWGIVEWGISDSTQDQATSYYDQAAQALESDLFPNLHAHMIFDSPGTHDQGGLRVGYDDAGNPDPDEQESYDDFANHPVFSEG